MFKVCDWNPFGVSVLCCVNTGEGILLEVLKLLSNTRNGSEEIESNFICFTKVKGSIVEEYEKG